MSILNDRDYRLAKARLAQLERATGGLAVLKNIGSQPSAEISVVQQQTLRSELARIRAEVVAYESLKRSDLSEIKNVSGENLGIIPVLARISRKMTQKELAEKLGIKEQQVQRYEKDRYSAVSLKRYQEILNALDVELHPRLSQRTVESAPVIESPLANEWSPELLRELRKRNWIDLPRTMAPSEMFRQLDDYVEGATKFASTNALNRRTAKDVAYTATVKLWTARVLNLAAARATHMRGRFNISDSSWLKTLVGLSLYPDGPLRAARMLREYGIIFVVEQHLPRSGLDGAALMISGNIPVIAMTIRHDRIDNFWFTLLHELGHVFLHFNSGLRDGFIDDDLDDAHVSQVEQEADRFAQANLIPDQVWSNSTVRFTKSREAVERFAIDIGVHPAIVAGRIRKERDYRLFSDLIGLGQVQRSLSGYSL